MSVLSDREIRDLCQKCNLVSPFDEERIKSASYDLSVGEEYRFSSEKQTRKLGKNGTIKLKKYEICYILVEETINLPDYISASIFFPPHELIRKGVLMYPQPPIDPGYSGRLYVLLHNLSNETVPIKRGDHLTSIVFFLLTQQCENPYSGFYQDSRNLWNLNLACDSKEPFEPYTCALKEVSEEIKSWREALLSKYIPILFIVLTVFLMFLTAIITMYN